jgi:glycosyltransferase involved in cell wall biosynthesis
MVRSYVPKFTYIIPFRYRQDRVLPMRRVVEWLSGFQGVEILLVEQDKHSKIDCLNLKVNHIFIKSEAPFNKSWAFNVGLKRANSSVIIFGDADFLMNPMELIESLKTLENCDCVIPTNKVVNLTHQESLMDTNSVLSLKRYQNKSNILDGISIFKKESIMKIGGWNEDLIGLGYENEFNILKIKKHLNLKQMEYVGYHMFHHPDYTPIELKNRNKQIFDIYNNDSNLIDQHIQQTFPKIGNAGRFANII